MKIGNLNFENIAFLAPMAGIADRAFRELCVQFGAAYTVTEMVSSKGLTMGDRKSAELLTIGNERPCGAQIFGDDPQIMAQAAIKCLEFKPDVIDINMGCPAPKVAMNGAIRRRATIKPVIKPISATTTSAMRMGTMIGRSGRLG